MGVLGWLGVAVFGGVALDAAVLLYRRGGEPKQVVPAGEASDSDLGLGDNSIDSFETDLWQASVTDTGDDSPFFL